MGTNYYVIENYCPHCNRGDIVYHLGKQSAGWKFLFHAQDNINSFDEWINFIKSRNLKIQDEYKRTINIAEFVSMVISRQDGLAQDTTSNGEVWKLVKDDYFVDALGFEFCKREFC